MLVKKARSCVRKVPHAEAARLWCVRVTDASGSGVAYLMVKAIRFDRANRNWGEVDKLVLTLELAIVTINSVLKLEIDRER